MKWKKKSSDIDVSFLFLGFFLMFLFVPQDVSAAVQVLGQAALGQRRRVRPGRPRLDVAAARGPAHLQRPAAHRLRTRQKYFVVSRKVAHGYLLIPSRCCVLRNLEEKSRRSLEIA